MVVTAYAAKISDRRSEVNCPLTFEARPYLQVSRTWGQGGDNIVGGDGSTNALEFKLPNWRDGDGVFDRHAGARKRKARRAHASGWWWTLCGFSYVARVLISQPRAAPLSRRAFTAAVAAGSAWSGLRAGSHAEVIPPRSGRR